MSYLRIILFLSIFMGFIPRLECSEKFNDCSIPQTLHSEITSKYPGFQVITMDMLSSKDRSIFQKDHPGKCPGAIQLDFLGNNMPAYVLTIIKFSSPKKKVNLILARNGSAKHWEIIPVESTDLLTVPVIWSEPPGEYEEIHTGKKIKAKNPVIIYCGYESWAIVYYWDGKEIKKIWIAD